MYVGLSDHYSCLVYQVRTEIVTFIHINNNGQLTCFKNIFFLLRAFRCFKRFLFFGDRDFPLSALFEKDVKRYR